MVSKTGCSAPPAGGTCARCEGCGSLWADPRPVADDLHLAYETYYTHEPSRPGPPAGGAPDRSGWKDRLHEAALHLPGHGVERAGPVAYLDGFPGRVLDVGCGDGANALALERAGWDVVAIDFDEQSIDAARAAGCRDARTTTIEELDEPAQSFDAVVSIHSIEHVPDPAALLAHIRRLLKPGGVISVVTPNAASWLSARHGPDWRGLEPPRHLQILTPKALERLLSDGGYWSPARAHHPPGHEGHGRGPPPGPPRAGQPVAAAPGPR